MTPPGAASLPRVRVTFRTRRLDSPEAFTLLSLIGHVAAIGAAFAVASLAPSRRPTPPDPGFFVSLAQLPPGGGAAMEPPAPKAEAPAPPAPPKPKEVLLPEKPKETPPKPRIEKPSPRPPEEKAAPA